MGHRSRLGGALGWAALALVAGCGSHDADPDPAAGHRPSPADERPPRAPGCRAAEAVGLEPARDTDAAVIAIADGWGYVALGSSGTLRLVPIDAAGRRTGPSRTVDMPGTPFALRATRRHRVLVTGDADAGGALTLHALAFPRDASSEVGAPATVQIGALDEVLAAAAEGDRVAIAYRGDLAAIRVLTLDVARDGAIEARIHDVGSEEHAVHELLALAVADRRWAAVYREQHGEATDGAVLVQTDASSATVNALFEAVAVEGFSIDDASSFAALATFEHDPTALLRFGPDGRATRAPVAIVAGSPTPAPFEGRLRAIVGGGSREIVVHVETLAGHSVGPSLTLRETDTGSLRADVTKAGGGFVAIVLDQSAGELVSYRIDCPPGR